jgi:hypothetical protein
MQTLAKLAVAGLAVMAVTGCGKRHKGPPSMSVAPAQFPGSYAQTCRDITLPGGGHLSASCEDTKGLYQTSDILASACQGDIANIDGVLTCKGATATVASPSGAPASDLEPASSAAG